MSQPSLHVRSAHWWTSLSDGDFDPDPVCGSWPHPGQVVAYYRELAGLARRDVSFRLNLCPKRQYYLEARGAGLDDIERRRVLCMLLSIPPELLGIAAAPASAGDGGWWVQDYQAWPAESDTGIEWPHPGRVTKFYRKAKGWTQSQLAEALGLTELSVRNMENQQLGLGSIARRRALAFLLSIPPLLLGLDAEHVVKELSATVLASKAPAPELIAAYRAAAHTLFTGYHTCTADQQHVTQALFWLNQVHEFATTVHGNQRAEMLETESLGYQALANITREYVPDATVLIYSSRAVQLARSAHNHDLLVVALQRRSETLFNRGYVDLAQRSIREILADPVEDDTLHAYRFAESARMLAVTATDEQDRSAVFALLEKAIPVTGEDTYYLSFTRNVLTTKTAETYNLLAANAPESQAKDLLRKTTDLLSGFSATSTRRAIRVKLELANAFFSLGEYDYAAQMAVEALPLMDEFKSALFLQRLNSLYVKLHSTKLRNDPRVARLGLYLFEHPVVL